MFYGAAVLTHLVSYLNWIMFRREHSVRRRRSEKTFFLQAGRLGMSTRCGWGGSLARPPCSILVLHVRARMAIIRATVDKLDSLFWVNGILSIQR